MSGDKLTWLLFFGGLVVTGVAGGLQTAGWRARLFWGVAILSGALTLAYLRAEYTGQQVVGAKTLWSLSPLIAVALALVAVSGREPRKRAIAPPSPPPKSPELNPALTASYFNNIVANGTKLEAKT